MRRKSVKNERHLDKIPELALTQAQTKINEIRAAFAPYTVALTPTERHEMLKMGEKSLAFVEKAHDFAKQYPELVPPYVDMDAFDVDFADAHGLWTLSDSVRKVLEEIEDTEMAAGSEAYQTALIFYNSVKVAAAQDIPGAKATFEDLRARFPSGKRRTTESNS
jgi:hypothetical protein